MARSPLKATANGSGAGFDVGAEEMPARGDGGASSRGQPVRSSGKPAVRTKETATRLPAHLFRK